MIYMIADRTGRLACEVESRITVREFVEWQVYFTMEHEAREKARRDAETKAQSKRRR